MQAKHNRHQSAAPPTDLAGITSVVTLLYAACLSDYATPQWFHVVIITVLAALCCWLWYKKLHKP